MIVCNNCAKSLERCDEPRTVNRWKLTAEEVPNGCGRRLAVREKEPPVGDFCSVDCLKKYLEKT